MRTELVYDVKYVATIKELVESSVSEHGKRVAILEAKNGVVTEVTYNRLMSDIIALSTYLNSYGYENKRIAVIGKNSYAWALSYLAVTCGVGVVVPIDKDLKPHDIDNILRMSEASVVLYSEEKQADIDMCSCECKKLSFADFDKYIAEGNELRDFADRSYENHKINPYELGVLLFTSGTTGIAKGVMLSQYNICWDIVGVMKRVNVTPEDRSLSVLPLHHTYECTAGLLAMLYSGASIAYSQGLRYMMKEFKMYSPTLLIAVPLLLEKFHSSIMKKIAEAKGGITLFTAGKFVLSISGNLKEYIAPKLFSAIHETFGGKLKRILCGAAALDPKIFSDLEKMGFKMYNGYGLTETSPVCIMHTDAIRNPSTVGIPLSGMKIKLDSINDDGVGEIAVSGENVMLGYYNNPEETEKVLRDGWFYTGDLAKKTPDGQYSIVGRIKSMIVTKNGKKIFPEEIEAYMTRSKLISECVVYGEDEENGDVTVSIKVFPNFEELDAKLLSQGINHDNPEYENAVKAEINAIVKEVNAKMPAYKMVRKVSIRNTEFEKTTTKKIKRGEAIK